jgi:hypothetical protein
MEGEVPTNKPKSVVAIHPMSSKLRELLAAEEEKKSG